MRRLFVPLGSYVEEGATIMLLLFLAVAAMIFFAYAALAVLHPYPLDYGEAPLVDQAVRLAKGQNIYRPDLSSPPYTVSNYPPLYVFVLTPLVWLFGPTFLVGRAVSVACALASGAFLASIIYVHTRDRLATVTTGMVFLAVPYVVHWSALLRIDMLALAFSLAGLYVVARWPLARWSTVAAALLLVAAICTRQSYALAAPLAAFVWLWTHDRRQALGLAALVGGSLSVLFLALNVLTHGGFFFNIVTANVNDFDMERLRWNLGRLWEAAPFLLVVGGVCLTLAPGRLRLWPVLVAYLIGAALSSLTIGKIGSNVNYFLELSAALSLAAGAVIAWTRKHQWLRATFLVLLALQVGHLMQTTLNEYADPLRQRRDFAKQLRDLEYMVAQADGPVLADEYMGLITRLGRPLYIQPFEVTQLAEAGLWDQTALVESIQNGEFPLILIHYFPEYPVYKERWTPEMLSAIEHAYVPANVLADTRVYRPRGRSIALQACAGAPWRLPTDAGLGVSWHAGMLDFFGEGSEKAVPVYAVADGRLMRRPDWDNGVAIQHDNPLRPGEKVWSYYADMADASGSESYIVSDFPPGSSGVPVERGQLLGYQGAWSGRPFWSAPTHLWFAVISAVEDGAFPHEVTMENVLDPTPYLGIQGNGGVERSGRQLLRCRGGAP